MKEQLIPSVLNSIQYEKMDFTQDGVKYDFDRYNVEMRSPMATHEYSVTVNHITKKLGGDVIRFGSWDDLIMEEIIEILELVEKEGKLERPFREYIPTPATVEESTPVVEKKFPMKHGVSMGEMYHLLQNLTYELEDSVEFMHTLSGNPEWIGCRCDAEDISSDECICVDEDGNIKRITDKEEDLRNANYVLKHIHQEYKVAMDEGKDDDSYRICDECGTIMTQGFCIDGGSAYYCSTECRDKHMTEEEFEELYDDGDGDTYWTQWEVYQALPFRVEEDKKNGEVLV